MNKDRSLETGDKFIDNITEDWRVTLADLLTVDSPLMKLDFTDGIYQGVMIKKSLRRYCHN
jgi:hypothetical protein